MATASLSTEALELLQHHSIDLKDFSKACDRYAALLKDLTTAPGGEAGAEATTAPTRLSEAWREYVGLVQQYLNRSVCTILRDLGGGGANCGRDAVGSSGDSPCAVKASAGKAGDVLSSVVVPVEPLQATADHVAPLSVCDAELARMLAKAPETDEAASLSLPVLTTATATTRISSSGARVMSVPSVFSSARARAERLNDLCMLLDKWYYQHEATLELPDSSHIAWLAGQAVASPSRVYRLLGMRVAYLCMGSALFAGYFMEDAEAVRWVGVCGDRNLFAEVELLLDLIARLTTLRTERPAGTFPSLPFGWVYRVAALLDLQDAIPGLPPKRKAQALRIAVLLLKHCPALSTAAGLHTALLSNCIAKGCATPQDCADVIQTLLRLFDNPSTRQYIQFSDISILFAPFLGTTAATGQDALATLNLAKEMIVLLLTSWVGILWVTSEVTCIRSLIDVLHLPGDLDRKMVLFTLFNKVLVRLAPHRGLLLMDIWDGIEADRQRRVAAAATISSANPTVDATDADSLALYSSDYWLSTIQEREEGDLHENFAPTTKALGYHVMDPILGLLLIALAHHGLPLALLNLLQTAGKNRVVMEVASQLLQDLCVLMDTVLPKPTVHSLHEAFNRAISHLSHQDDPFVRSLTSQLFHNYKKNNHLAPGSVGSANSRGLGAGSCLGSCASVTAAVGAGAIVAALPGPAMALAQLDMDDAVFLKILQLTRVEQSPQNFRAWNFDLLLALVQGQLRVLHRQPMAQGLLQKLLGFYTPRSPQDTLLPVFSTLAPCDATVPMCLLGISLMDLLLSTRQGTKLLVQLEVPAAIANMLREVRVNTAPSILTTERVGNCIGQTLLRMVGRLSFFANGLLLMQEYNLLPMIDGLFLKLCGPRLQTPSSTDPLQEVCRQLLPNLYLGAVPNYGVCEDVRYTFRSALRNASDTIRLCAVTQLTRAVWRDLPILMKWGIETLVKVLRDEVFEVVACAFKLLLNICLCSDEGLDYFISLTPTVLMESALLRSNGDALHLEVLLYRIVGRPSGLAFLQAYGWVEQELHRWETGESLRYARRIMESDTLALGNGSPMGGGTAAATSPGWRHMRSFSDSAMMFHTKRSFATSRAGFLPCLRADTTTSVAFFPVHFVAALCRSREGSAVFCQSALWTRSVQSILRQPLPPDMVYDSVSGSGGGESSEESEGDMSMEGEAVHLLPGKFFSARTSAPISTRYYHHDDGRGAASLVDGRPTSHVHAELAQSSFARFSMTGTSLGPGCATGEGSCSGAGAAADGAVASIAPCAGARATAPDPAATARKVRQLLRGKLTYDNVFLSAARGYHPVTSSFLVTCVGDSLALMDAIMCVCQAGSSDAGYDLICTIPNLLSHLCALCRFASTISVRCTGMVGLTLLARSRHASEALAQEGVFFLNNPNAYISADGVPYSVAFAHWRVPRSMFIGGKKMTTNTAVHHTYADGKGLCRDGVDRRICENVLALSNPVSREAAKGALHKIMQRYPQLFTHTNVQRFCLDAASLYPMRHTERKFLADLMEIAQSKTGMLNP